MEEMPRASNKRNPDQLKKTSSYYVYVMKCADKTLYVGITTDLVRRLSEHNTSKKGARYTKMRRPVHLLYSEKCLNRSEALKREGEIKSWSRERKLEFLAKPTGKMAI